MGIRKIAFSRAQQKTLIVCCCALVIVAAVCALFYYRTAQFVESSRKVEEIHRVLYEIEETDSALKDAETGARGYVATGNEDFLGLYQKSVGEVAERFGKVRLLAAQSRAQQQWLDEVEPLIAERTKSLAEAVRLRRQNNPMGQNLAAFNQDHAKIQAISRIFGGMKAEQNNLLKQRTEESAESERGTLQTLFSISFIMILLLIIGYFQIRESIAESERAETMLAEERDFISAIMENTRALTLVLDREGRIIRFNRACEQSSGCLYEDVRGKNFWDVLLPPEEKERVSKAFYRLKPEDYPTTHENLWLSRKGERRLISWSNNALLDNNGEIRFTIGTGIDITERRRAEQALEQNLSLLSSTLEATDNAIIAIDLTGKIVAYNQKYLQMWGIGDAEIKAAANLREHAKYLTQIKDSEEFIRKSNEFMIRSPEQPNYLLLEFKDGRIYERFSHPQIQNGVVVGRVLSFRDITSQKQSELALRESEERNRELIDKSLGLISTHDLAGRWLSLNPATANALDGAPEQFVGKSVADILSPDYRPLFTEYLKIIKEKRAAAGLMHVVTPAGDQRILTYNNVLVEEPGKSAYILGHAQDITPLRRAEEEKRIAQQRLQFHLENSRIALIEWSRDWRVLSWSPGAEKIFGWLAAEVLDKTVEKDFKFIYDEDKPGVRVIQEELSGGKDMAKPRSNRNYTKDGAVITCEWYSSVQFDAKGEITSIMALAHDITERQQMEAELREARDAALESARLKSEFLANMSHEIRTPMNGVIGMTDLLVNTDLNEEQREYAETVRSSAGALLTVINDILDFSKIEAGKLSFETIDFDLRAAVESAVSLFAEQAQQKNLELASLVEANVPIALRGDPGRLRQILNNLVSNGVKFTASGEVVVRVALAAETADAVQLNFSVRDTGIGIGEATQKHLFEAFMQADGSTTRKYGGTGLGLAISKQLVEMMNGELRVQSAPNQGSTFSFNVKFEKQPAAPPRKKALSSAGLQNLRVLIVDDNETNRKILQHQVQSFGMKAETAENGADALNKLRRAAETQNNFDLAVLDLMMPEMDGFELADRIKDDFSINAVKLILMPSFGMRGHGQSARAAGIAGYLTKPVRQNDLFDCLAAVAGDDASSSDAPDEQGLKKLITRHTLSENRSQTRQSCILVAEDNLVNQKVIKGQLERLGYQADVVNNGVEALTALRKQSYSLVLMDCQMPEMDGYAAAAEIRRRENGSRRTPLIAVTANAMQGEREKCLAAGMDDYLSKPLKINVLQEVVERWLDAPEKKHVGKTDTLGEKTEEPAALVDLIALNDVTDGDPEMLRQIISLYLEQTDELLTSLSEMVARQNSAEIYQLAHKILGSSATCGMQTMISPLKKLEKMGRSNNLACAAETFSDAETNYRALRIYLINLLAQNN